MRWRTDRPLRVGAGQPVNAEFARIAGRGIGLVLSGKLMNVSLV